MPRQAEAARTDALSESLLHALEARRQRGGEAYPPTLRTLAEECEGSPPVEQVIKAVGKKPLAGRVVAIDKEGRQAKADSPLYFKEDVPSKPELERRKVAELAERLRLVLESQRQLGDDSYPPTLRRLAELCDLRASDGRIAKALAHETLASRVVVAAKLKAKPNPEAPALLTDDVARAIPALIGFALESARMGEARAFTGKDLAKKLVPALKKPIEEALGKARIEHKTLPPGVAWVAGHKGVPLLFHIEDLRPSAHVLEGRTARPTETPTLRAAETAAPEVATPPAAEVPEGGPRDFERAFRAAFDRLDRRNGGTNFVKLSDLRRALPEFGRDAFDAGLRQLRLGRQFSLDSHEGLHGTLTPEDREAGIPEMGLNLVYASRR